MIGRRPIRICFYSLNAYCMFNPLSKASIGGGEVDLYNLATELAKDSNYEVLFITGDWGQNKIEKIENITVIKSFSNKKSLLNILMAPIKLFKACIKADAEIYLTTTVSPEVGILSLYCGLFRKRFIYRTAHDMECNKEYIKNNKLKGRLYKFGLEHADSIIVTVKKHAKLLNKYHPKIKNISFVPLLMGGVRGMKDIKKEFILWVARDEKWKRPELFLELAKRNPDKKFVMIMPINNPKYHREITNKAEKISNLKLIPGVKFEEVNEYFNKAYLFVNTSIYEGFTLTIIQAGMNRTPVAYLKVNPNNIITKYKLGFWADDNFESLVDFIQKIKYKSKEWIEYSNNIYDYILENHELSNNIYKLKDEFIGLVKK